MKAETCIGFLFCFATVCSQNTLEHIGEQLENSGSKNEISPFCMAGKCAGVPYERIQSLYRGLFFTKEEIKINLIKTKKYTERRCQIYEGYKASLWKPKSWKRKRETCGYGHSSLTDGDVCCPTSISAMCPEYLTNTNGTRRIIVHFPGMQPDPMYQFIPRGLCQSGGNCQTCRQEFALLNILVVDETFRSYPPLEFDSFYIHSYCSCKG